MYSLGRSYMLITSGSLRVKQHEVIHCHLNFTQVQNILDISIPIFLIFWGWRKCFVRKLCCKGQHPPWCYPILFGLCCYYQVQRNIIISHFCEYDIAWKQKPKENQKKKKKGRNIIDSGNVLGWTPTVSRGTDVETLHKLSYLCRPSNPHHMQIWRF